jgi:hypothetical protein
VEKISPARQDNLRQAQIADSSSKNSVSFSSVAAVRAGNPDRLTVGING